MKQLDSPLVSIIIPVYNGSNYLRKAINSALCQTYKNIEVIVVNDGSNDGGRTDEIAKSYGDKIRYFSKKNGGVATALNTGINMMTGEYFSWLSHDDVYYPHKLETQIKYLTKIQDKNIALYSDFEFIDQASNFLRSHCIDTIEPKMFKYSLITGNPIHGCTALIPKSCFDKCGVFDEALITTQDYDMWFRIAKKYSFIHIPKILIKSRLHDEQCSRVIKGHLKEKSEYFIKCLNEIPPIQVIEECREPLSIFYSKIAINLKKRGYSDASKYALLFSLRSLKNSSGKSYLSSFFFISYCLLWRQWMEKILTFQLPIKFFCKRS